MRHGPLGRLDVVRPRAGVARRTASATTSGEFSGTDGQTGPGVVVDALQRQRQERGPGAVDLVHADGAEVAEETGEMGDGRGADLGGRRRRRQLGGRALQHAPAGPPSRARRRAAARCPAPARRDPPPPPPARGRRRRSGGRRRGAAAPARRAPGRGRTAAPAAPTARRSGGTARRGPPAGPPAIRRCRRPGTSGSRRGRPVATTSCTVGDSRSTAASAASTSASTAAIPSWRSRPPSSRRSTQHRSASRVSITRPGQPAHPLPQGRTRSPARRRTAPAGSAARSPGTAR